MSFDAFEARMQFLQLLKKLNASAQSIQKVVGFAVKYGARCGEDLWEVIMDECEKGTLNTRINILYFLDSLLDISHSLGPPDAPYLSFIARDLGQIVERVVPETREGVLNLRSARQILDSWRTRRVIDVDTIDSVLKALSARSFSDDSSTKKRGHSHAFSRDDIIRRIEEDRERHKRLRERIWILPIPPLIPPKLPSSLTSSSSNPSPASPFTPASPSARQPPQTNTPGGGIGLLGGKAGLEGKMLPPPPPAPGQGAAGKPGPEGLSALEMEFEQTWEGAGELNDDDLQRMKRDAELAGLLSDAQ